MIKASDFRKLATECRQYAARCSIPAHAAALIDTAQIYEARAAQAEALSAGATVPVRLFALGEREAPQRV
jgi:hypothetical protein